MGKSIPAIVTPEVLQWARGLDRISIEEIALKLKVDVAKIEAWENGSEYPTLPQAKRLAKQYRVPFAYLYLPDTPQQKDWIRLIIEHLAIGELKKCLVNLDGFLEI